MWVFLLSNISTSAKMKKIVFSILMFTVVFSVRAQYLDRHYQNIINEKVYDILVAESSGEKIINNIADVASYELSERDYNNLKESSYFIEKLRKYGLEEVKLNRYPGAKAWSASKGVLYEITPKMTKLADFTDLPASLCEGSVTTKVDSAQLVWVGRASSKELEGLDLKGKIAFGDAMIYSLHDACVKKGALGVVSCFSHGDGDLRLMNLGLYSENPSFGFQLTKRDGEKLRDRLIRGEVVYVSCNIKSDIKSFDYQSPSCVIKGTQPELDEIVLSAHLFEGYSKLGANDNMSGSAVLLDVARTLITLVNEGKIARPLRTLRFIWGDEFNGVIPWVKERSAFRNKLAALFNLNLDMVGVNLEDNHTTYVLHRNTFATSHYSSDLIETVLHYMSVTNQKSIILGDFLKPVIAKSGSDNPFRYSVTPYYSASDHSVFCDWGVGVPAVMMITWPDNNYHTSQDRVEFLDPTQLKRASVIASTLVYAVATAKEKEAQEFAALCYGGAVRRLGMLNASLLSRLNEKSDKSQYIKALEDLSALCLVEKKEIESVCELQVDSEELINYAKKVSSAFQLQIEASKKVICDTYLLNKGKEFEHSLDAEQKKAAKTFYKPLPKIKEGGYGVLSTIMSSLNKTESKKELLSEIKSLYLGNINTLVALTNCEELSLFDIYMITNLESTNGKKVALSDIKKLFDVLEDEGALHKIIK